jgi:hypothetical protein
MEDLTYHFDYDACITVSGKAEMCGATTNVRFRTNLVRRGDEFRF